MLHNQVNNIERKLAAGIIDEDGNPNEEIINSPFCSAKIKTETKGVARIEVKIIRPDLSYTELSKQIVELYESVMNNLEAKNIKTEDWKTVTEQANTNQQKDKSEANINKKENDLIE